MKDLIPQEIILSKIYLIRGRRVMLDKDLAELYGVETRVLNQAVKRNNDRFPDDFMLTLSKDEIKGISQIVISLKFSKNVNVFTEYGVLMLANVIKSSIAVEVSIAIVRTFAKLREMVLTHKDLRERIEQLEKKYDENFAVVFETLKQLIIQEEQPKKKIGFHTEELN